MVDVLGHLGMALLWLAPVWYFIGHRRTAALVVAGGFWFGMLPDTDLLLSAWVPGIHHHGVLHTVLAATVFALVLGLTHSPSELRNRTPHRKVGRIAASAWLLSLALGVVTYLLLNHVFAWEYVESAAAAALVLL